MAEEKKESSFRDRFASFVSNATEIGKNVIGNVKEGVQDAAEKGKETVGELYREHEANKIYEKLGKKVYKLVMRSELQLPESCDKYIESLKALYADAEKKEDEKCDEEKCCEDDEDKEVEEAEAEDAEGEDDEDDDEE